MANLEQRSEPNQQENHQDKNFSDEELQQFMTAGKQLASKPVISAVIAIIEEGPSKGFDKDEADNICKRLKQLMPYNYCGFTQVEFREVSYKLNISLSLVPRTYKAEVEVPTQEYAKDLYQQYDFLKNIAIAYWRQFIEDNDTLFKRICNYRTDIDFSQLVIDKINPTTMYIDPECDKRIGIFPYWVSANGQPLFKSK